MKVAVVSPNRGRYSETFIRAHVERLPAEVGTTVHLHGAVLPLWQDGERRLPPRAFHLAGRLAEKLFDRDRRKVTSFLARQLPNRFRERALARRLRREGVDVVLAEFGHTGVTMSPVASRLGIPLVVYFHGYEMYRRGMLEEYGDDYQSLFSRCAAVVVGSRAGAEQLQRLGAPESVIKLCPCGVDLSKFSPANPADSGLTLVAVGRFVEKKAPHLLLLAFAQIVQAFPEAKLRMAGEGPLLDACKTLAIALGVSGRVEFLGAIPHGEIVELLSTARAFVQHSVRAPNGDSETTGISVREAMASSLPVVATRHAGIGEAVLHEDTGFLVNEHDWRSMAMYLAKLLENPDLASTMGRAGRQRAEHHFSIESSISDLASVLQEATSVAK